MLRSYLAHVCRALRSPNWAGPGQRGALPELSLEAFPVEGVLCLRLQHPLLSALRPAPLVPSPYLADSQLPVTTHQLYQLCCSFCWRRRVVAAQTEIRNMHRRKQRNVQPCQKTLHMRTTSGRTRSRAGPLGAAPDGPAAALLAWRAWSGSAAEALCCCCCCCCVARWCCGALGAACTALRWWAGPAGARAVATTGAAATAGWTLGKNTWRRGSRANAAATLAGTPVAPIFAGRWFVATGASKLPSRAFCTMNSHSAVSFANSPGKCEQDINSHVRGDEHGEAIRLLDRAP